MALAQACYSSPPPDAYTSQGFGVYLNVPHAVRLEDVSTQIDLQGQAASEIMAADVLGLWYELGSDIHLTLTDDCLGPRCAWAGYTTFPTSDEHVVPAMVVLWQSPLLCVSRSALSHELTHAALLLIDGDADGAHLEDWAWNGPGSITEYANRMGVWQICGDG